jgi:transcriptional regulator GlxA family with amidase domain
MTETNERTTKAHPTTKIGVVVYPGFDELDAVAPFEVLRKAAAAGAALEVNLVAREVGPVTGSQGMTVVVAESLRDTEAGRFDWLVVAGGSWAARGDVGAWGEIQRGELPRLLAAHARAGTKMASVCTGAMLLSAAGLTRGRRAVTHHVALAALAEEGAAIVDARVVDDGDLITAGGVTSGLDLALWFVERACGAGLAARLADTMEYTRVGEVSRRADEREAPRQAGRHTGMA